MNKKEIDEGLQGAIRLGWIKKNPSGTFSITEKGKKHVEDILLPGIGMTEKQFLTQDGLRETISRIDQRNRLRRSK